MGKPATGVGDPPSRKSVHGYDVRPFGLAVQSRAVALVDGAADLGPPAGAAGDGPGEVLPLYLQEIGRVALLTAADEVRLAQAIERGRLAGERLRTPAT